MATGRGKAGRSGTSGARRVLRVLSILLEGRTDVGVTEVSRTVGCSKSMAHRSLVVLAESGFVTVDPATRRYRLERRALGVPDVESIDVDLKAFALPYLRQVRDQTSETAILTLLQSDLRVYVDQVGSRERVHQTVQIGQEAPLYAGASGKAILAFMPPQDRARIILTAKGARKADGSRFRLEAIEADLDRTRRRGYALSRGERILGACSVAAPIFNHQGGVIGSIVAAGVMIRSDPTRLASYGVAVVSAARSLSRRLDSSGSSTA